LVDSLDLDTYEASALSSGKKRKIQKKSSSGFDSDDDLDLFVRPDESERAHKSAKGHNRGIIDSDDE